MPQWHYLRSNPHCAISAQVLDHMKRSGRAGELVSAAYFQSVLYFALSLPDGRVTAVICPLDRSGEFGRFTTGYCAFDENELPEQFPSSWARCPDQVIAALTPTTNVVASAWRTRCVSYRAALSRLGRITKGSLLRLQRPLEIDGLNCRLLQCEDARKNLYAVLDAKRTHPVHLSRDTIAEHGGVCAEATEAADVLGSGFEQLEIFVRRKTA